MPLKYPADLVKYLNKSGVKYVVGVHPKNCSHPHATLISYSHSNALILTLLSSSSPTLIALLSSSRCSHPQVVGHTPHGNAPTIIRHDSEPAIDGAPAEGEQQEQQEENVIIVMVGSCVLHAAAVWLSDSPVVMQGDTSYSHQAANHYYNGDNRGKAVSVVQFDGSRCTIKGQTENNQQIDYTLSTLRGDSDQKIDPFIGRVADVNLSQNTWFGDATSDEHREFFVKSKLAAITNSVVEKPVRYVLNNVQGFETQDVINGHPLPKLTRNGSSGCRRMACGEEVSELVDEIFKDPSTKKPVEQLTRRQLIETCTSRITNMHIHRVLPHLTIKHLTESTMRKDLDEIVTKADFEKEESECRRLQTHSDDWAGVFFPIIDPSVVQETEGNFPQSIGPYKMEMTKHILPNDLEFSHIECDEWETHGRRCTLQLDSDIWQRSDTLTRTQKELKKHKAALHGHLSALHPVTISPLDVNYIPEGAKWYTWCFPFFADWRHVLAEATADPDTDPDVAFLSVGGFVYLDENYKSLQISSLSDANAYSQEALSVAHAPTSLKFGAPVPLCDKWVEQILMHADLQPITFRKYLKEHAQYFCYMSLSKRDGELQRVTSEIRDVVLQASKVTGESGGFIYIGNDKFALDQKKSTLPKADPHRRRASLGTVHV